jgi:hypothetical protein
MAQTGVNVELVRRLMAERKLPTAAHLARASGVDRMTIQRLLDGKNFTRDTLDAVATALGVKGLDLLLSVEDQPQSGQ